MAMTKWRTPPAIMAATALALTACGTDFDKAGEELGERDSYVALTEADLDRAMAAAKKQSVAATSAPAIHATPPRFYTVLFELGSNKLNASGVRVVNQIAADWGVDATSLKLVGHTDASGGDGYNQKLSQRRADAVRDELLKRGIENERLIGNGVGETQLLVPTPDGVSDRHNRRVTITVD